MLRRDPETKKLARVPSREVVTVLGDSYDFIGCEVNFTNYLPDFLLTILKEGINEQVTSQFKIQVRLNF